MRSLLKQLLHTAYLYYDYYTWNRSSTRPPPFLYKIKTLMLYQNYFNLFTLIETGTCTGDTIARLHHIFTTIHTIELDDTLATHAQQRFLTLPHITVHHGDSGILLRTILSDLTTPSLFWLDAHYSGPGTAHGTTHTPILQELTHIFSHHINHIILIDDAHAFTGYQDYPTLTAITHLASTHNYRTLSKNGIIRLVPTTLEIEELP